MSPSIFLTIVNILVPPPLKSMYSGFLLVLVLLTKNASKNSSTKIVELECS